MKVTIFCQCVGIKVKKKSVDDTVLDGGKGKKLEVCICNNSSSAGIGCCIDAASYSRATLEYLLAGHVYNIDKYLTGLFYLLGHPVFQT